MKLFSRKESAKSARTNTSSRASGADQAQLDTLRGRARRRLIGALVLVVAAVIIVPQLINTPPESEQSAPIVLPTPIPAMPSAGEQQLAMGEPEQSVSPSNQAEQAVPDDFFDPAVADEPVQLPPAPALPESASVTPPTVTEQKPATSAPAKPEPPKPQKPAQPSKPAVPPGRTDDGSVAIALLEGRAPTSSSSAPAKAQQGSFVLQIAAYTTSQDANARRSKLQSEGVSNAFVEQANLSGKTTWRLRVGPFPTREAAQAAQTRLRALGYENSFISSK